MSSTAAPPRPPAQRVSQSAGTALARLQRRKGTVDLASALLVAAALCAVAFVGEGGLRLAAKTWIEIALILGDAAIIAIALVLPPRDARLQRLHGRSTLIALAVLGALTALSITWSLAPDESWLEANRTFAYVFVFAGGIALVRLLPNRWTALLHGLALASVVICGYALLTKVFPGWLARDELFARLRAPFGYWNAIGLMAAMGVPPLVWLAARRSGHLAVSALSYPALGLVLTTLLLSYSRGALLALLIGMAFWFSFVPLRLRGAAALVAGIVGAAIVCAWAFNQDALTSDRASLNAREDAGLAFGLLLLGVLAAQLAAALAIAFRVAQSPPGARARGLAGRAIVGFLAALPVAGLIALALAPGGVDGQTSKAWKSMTASQPATPPNTPARLTATASVRSRYWREALDIWDHHKLTGAGAGSFVVARTRYRTGVLAVRHAHGYVVQTLGDLGLLGLAAALAALAAWLAAALRTTGLRTRALRRAPYGPERIGLLTLVTVVVVFGAHSFVDWTWFVPGTAVTALLCAGWVAGRGPLVGTGRVARVVGAAPVRWAPDPVRAAVAGAVALIAIAAVWAVVQPLRAQNAENAAERRLEAGQPEAARRIAQIAHERNPLSVQPYFTRFAIEERLGQRDAALRALGDAVALQPANAETWRRLGRYQLFRLDQPVQALPALRAAYFLDPAGPEAVSDFIEVTRRVTGVVPEGAPAPFGGTAP